MKYDDIDIFENDIKGYSLGGSISGDIRELQGRPESEDLFTPAQASWFLSQLPPGTGLLDVSRGTPAMPSSEADPSEFYSGELQGTLAENLARGNYLESALQGVGALGDLAYGIPVAGVVAGPALKGLSAAGRAGLKSLTAADEPLRAYHSSPFEFDEFQLEKIGTGEGNQAFGYGLYFGEAPETGKFYRDMFDNKTGGIFFGAKKVESKLGDDIADYADVDFEKGFPEIFNEVDGNPDQQLDRIQDLLDDYLGVDPEIVDTSMYQEGSANLLKLTDELEKKYPDEDVVYRLREDLEYDLGIPRDEIDALEDMSYEFKKNKKALNEILAEMDSINRYSVFRSGTAEAEDVAKEIDGMSNFYTGRQKRLFDFHVKPRIQIKEGSAKTYEVDLDVEKEKLIDWDTPLNEQSEFVQDAVKNVWRDAVEDPEVKKMLDGLDEYNMQQTGENQYETLARRLGSPKQLSEALDKQGVKGIQYADGFTRDKGGVSKNFVIFDPRVIDISKRYGVPIAIAGGMLMKMDQAKEELDTNNVDIFN